MVMWEQFVEESNLLLQKYMTIDMHNYFEALGILAFCYCVFYTLRFGFLCCKAAYLIVRNAARRK